MLCQAVGAVADETGKKIPVVYTSSTQADRDNAYGSSKRYAENALFALQREHGVPVHVFRLPNVFGKWCKPNYNSVVATFCHNITRGFPIQVNDPAAPVTLVYVDDVVARFLQLMDGADAMANADGFATVDPRGVFVEMLKTPDCGQFSYFTAVPGITRGGHYHHSKTEKFLVIRGQARFRFRHIQTGETHQLLTSGDKAEVVETVPGWAHDITNIGTDEMVVMLWGNEIFDSQQPDALLILGDTNSCLAVYPAKRRKIPVFHMEAGNRCFDIGVQTLANLSYFDHWMQRDKQRVEVLQNWLADEPDTGCSIVVAEGSFAGRKIFVYAGNMGVAQGMDVLLDLAEQLQGRKDIGFLFVGRGHDAERLQSKAKTTGLNNVAFYDEIDPTEIPGLYAQCHIGLVAIDPRHKTHNIPGKFLSYMQCGLPVLATINPGNDLETLITTERVGRVCSDSSIVNLQRQAEELIDAITVDPEISFRCKSLSARLFSPEVAVKHIISALRTT